MTASHQILAINIIPFKSYDNFTKKNQNVKLAKLNRQIKTILFNTAQLVGNSSLDTEHNIIVTSLLIELIEDCQSLTLNNDFFFQQDGAPAHTARLTQERIERNCRDFIRKDEWPQNSPDLNPLDYHVWGAMLEKYHLSTPSQRTRRS